MGPYGHVWGPIGSQPHRIAQVGSELEAHRVQPEPNHPALNVGSCGVVGGSCGVLWGPVGLYGVLWDCMGSYGDVWDPVWFCGVTEP